MTKFEPYLYKTILSLKESATLAINQKAKALRAQGKTVYHFGFGQSPFPVHAKIQKALADNTDKKEYLPTRGLPELRETICRYYKNHYDFEFSADQLLIGPGSKELIFQALFVLEGPLLIPAPSWVSYGPQAHIRGKKVIPIQTQKKNDYKLTAQELDQACLQHTEAKQKILIINNPNNPTGSVYLEKEIAELSNVCRKHHIVLISDEIYSLIDFAKERYVGFSKYYPEGTIVTGGLSKGHSAGGYRLGFLAAPDNMKHFMHCLSAMVSETFSAVSAPIQYAAIVAFSDDQEINQTLEQCRKIHQAAGEYLYSRLTRMHVGCVKPQGAFYLFPDFQDFSEPFKKLGITKAQEMTHYFLDQLSIACLPASTFYCPVDYLACRMASVDYDGKKVLEASYSAEAIGTRFIEENCPQLKNGCDVLEGFLKGL